ncbi:hypothetical protein PR202_gb25369 [Eleusine coracana subsp. coracana]|uniref:ATP synthase subunit d, mitochondrial n=1 Tax=Eleusine coracana subsp. coracana TaxID=191504 RepID=A0AAV5FLB8_ELECO|nr:hypothetical protein PR202_gb25325 [Eleusine coracana subsp. coracana]GJN36506.1 hypothetical protein PR202_gb25369 [Eleusine coracana subsp. coracana]
MSGTVKKVSDTTVKAGRTMEWDGMAKMLVSEEARKAFATLRRNFEDVNHQVQTKFSQVILLPPSPAPRRSLVPSSSSPRAAPQPRALVLLAILLTLLLALLASPSRHDLVLYLEPQPIDWEYYKKGIGSKVVDMYKEAYESIEIPKYVDTVTPQYKPKFDALMVELKEAEKISLKESESIEKEIAEMKEMKKKISTMTADEYFEKHPELKQKFDDEIRNDYWGY